MGHTNQPRELHIGGPAHKADPAQFRGDPHHGAPEAYELPASSATKKPPFEGVKAQVDNIRVCVKTGVPNFVVSSWLPQKEYAEEHAPIRTQS